MDACLSCRRAVQAEPSSVPLRLQHRRAQNASPTCRRGIQNLSCIVHSDAVLWRWRAARRRRRAARRRRRRRRRGSNTGQTSTATHRGRLGRVAIRTGSSARRVSRRRKPLPLGQKLSTPEARSVCYSQSLTGSATLFGLSGRGQRPKAPQSRGVEHTHLLRLGVRCGLAGAVRSVTRPKSK